MGFDHKECLTSGLVAALECGRHSDVAIEVEEKTFHCHKVVLEALSSYFRSLFIDGTCSTSHMSLRISELTKRGFEGALLYIYSGKTDLNETSVFDVLQASFFLKIESLREHCEDMLMRELLKPDSCIRLWQVAESYGCQKLLKSARLMALKLFDEVAVKTKVSDFSADQLEELFQEEQLNVDSEVTLLSIAVRWAQLPEADFEECCSIFCAVRLDLISEEECKQVMDTEGKNLSKELHSFFHSHWTYSRMKSPSERKESIRYLDKEEKVLVFIDETGSTGCFVLASFYHLDAEDLPFPPIAPQSEEIISLRCCVHQQDLYVECLVDEIAKFLKFSSQTGEWLQYCARNNDDVSSCSVLVSSNSFIYAVQGSRRISKHCTSPAAAKIQKYCCEQNSWTTLCTLPDSVEDPVVVAASSFLCIYSRSHSTTTVYAYSYQSDVIREMGQLPHYVPKPEFAIESGRNRFLFCQREVTRVKNILDEPYTLDVFDELGKYTRKNFRVSGVVESGRTIYCLSSTDDEHYILWEFSPDKLTLRRPRRIHAMRKWCTGGVVEIKRRFLMT